MHAHTHTFSEPLSGTTRVSRYQKGKTNLDFTEARDSEWQWHQLGRMQVCTSFQTDNHASTPPLSFLQAGFPSCHPTNSIKALKAQKISSTMKRKPNEIQNTGLSAQTQVTTYCRKAWAGIQYSIIPHSMCAQEPTVLVIIRHLHDH